MTDSTVFSKNGRSVLKTVLNTCISIQDLFGTPEHRFTYEANEFRFPYTNADEFFVYKDSIEDGFTEENIPVSELELSSDFDAQLDIGAHYGVYSVILGVLNPTIPLHSFEPSEESSRILSRTLRKNGVSAKIHEKVVSNSPGTTDFFEAEDERLSQTHGTKLPSGDGYAKKTKQTVSIADFLKRQSIQHPFIKIDAEGEESSIVQDLFTEAELDGVKGIVEIHPDKMENATKDDVLTLIENEGGDYEMVSDRTTLGDFEYDYPAYKFEF